MPQVGFESKIPASKRLQTHVLYRADTELGRFILIKTKPLVLKYQINLVITCFSIAKKQLLRTLFQCTAVTILNTFFILTYSMV